MNKGWKSLVSRYFIRKINFGEDFEIFFVSAILAILGLRIYLELTDFRIVGSGNIHIAHMLWGGMLMLFSITLFLTFLGRNVKKFAALLGGVGFGIFIDELGKFITRDNNYFYQPTFSIIYIIFVLLYLMSKAIQGRQNYSDKEYLANGIEYIEEAINNEMDAEEKKEAIKYLQRADLNNPITKALIQLCEDLEAIPKGKPDIFTRIKKRVSSYYYLLIKKHWVQDFIEALFIIHLFGDVFFIGRYFWDGDHTVSSILNILATIAAGIFVVWGLFDIRDSRLKAYQKFKISLLISIFFSSSFYFLPRTAQGIYCFDS